MGNLDLVEFDVSADKSSTEGENEGFKLTHAVTSVKTPRSPATASKKNYRQ